MTELQEEVEELRKLTWVLTKKINELAARLNVDNPPPRIVVTRFLDGTLEPVVAPDENDKGSD